jgi:hypothetical protein
MTCLFHQRLPSINSRQVRLVQFVRVSGSFLPYAQDPRPRNARMRFSSASSSRLNTRSRGWAPA